MKKATQLYIVDALLAVAFILAGITGVIKMPGWFSIKQSWILPLMRIHDLSGIIMVILVGIHLVQHWKWIVAMTKRLIIENKKIRNIFIIIIVMILTAILSLGAYSITSNMKKDSNTQDDTSIISDEQELFVKTGGCPYGIHDDPLPGLCALYTDKNNNGECDYGE